MAILPPTKKSAVDKKKNTQELFFYWKTYNLGAPGNHFIISSTFVQPGVISKGTFLTHQIIKYKM